MDTSSCVVWHWTKNKIVLEGNVNKNESTKRNHRSVMWLEVVVVVVFLPLWTHSAHALRCWLSHGIQQVYDFVRINIKRILLIQCSNLFCFLRFVLDIVFFAYRISFLYPCLTHKFFVLDGVGELMIIDVVCFVWVCFCVCFCALCTLSA